MNFRTKPNISFVIPVYNEELILLKTIEKLKEVLSQLHSGEHQLLFIDDGSSDSTLSILKIQSQLDSRITVLSFSRNFGHQSAVTAGLHYSTGDVTIVMDSDLQDPPELVFKFLEKYYDGYEVVYAVRKKRKEGFIKRFFYFIFYRMINKLSQIDLPLDSGDFALMSKKVVDQLKLTQERSRYMRGLRTWVGFKQIGVEYERAERGAGVSKYSFLKLLELAFSGIFSFSTIPLRFVSFVGFIGLMFSFLYVFYALFMKIVYSQPPPGFTALIVSFSFLTGLVLMSLGVIGEYIGRIYEEVKARPHYIVQEVFNKKKLSD